ncbi:MAG: hypothetical protein JJU06_05610 [Ectothiorhodospiraceae bacterium]|nr:hypothetical protein [Ectothiorhodospiraceae bacterium]
MDRDAARQVFEAGEFSEAVVEPATVGNGWMVLLYRRTGEHIAVTDHAGLEKVYHDLDQAVEVAKSIGFEEVRIAEAF